MKKDAIYIVFEGHDNAGKTTRIEAVRQFIAEKYPDKKLFITREPDAPEYRKALGSIQNEFWNIVKKMKLTQEYDELCEYIKLGQEQIEKKIEVFKQDRILVMKAIEDSDADIIVSDRCFLSNLAYQTTEAAILNEEAFRACDLYNPDNNFFMNTDTAELALILYKSVYDKVMFDGIIFPNIIIKLFISEKEEYESRLGTKVQSEIADLERFEDMKLIDHAYDYIIHEDLMNSHLKNTTVVELWEKHSIGDCLSFVENCIEDRLTR